MINVNLHKLSKATAAERFSSANGETFAVVNLFSREVLGELTIYLENVGQAWLLLDAAQDAVDMLQEPRKNKAA